MSYKGIYFKSETAFKIEVAEFLKGRLRTRYGDNFIVAPDENNVEFAVILSSHRIPRRVIDQVESYVDGFIHGRLYGE